jgi:hypothetical protein
MSDTYSHPAARENNALLAECEVRRLRRSGPGGQNRNKVETAVCLHHRPTGVESEANERRSQAQNQTEALFRLRVNLALQLRSEGTLETFPTALWRSRCTSGRMKLSGTNDNFPSLLAEALDVLALSDFEPKPAALRLGCTASQLLKLLKLDPRALALVNRARTVRQLHDLV